MRHPSSQTRGGRRSLSNGLKSRVAVIEITRYSNKTAPRGLPTWVALLTYVGSPWARFRNSCCEFIRQRMAAILMTVSYSDIVNLLVVRADAERPKLHSYAERRNEQNCELSTENGELLSRDVACPINNSPFSILH